MFYKVENNTLLNPTVMNKNLTVLNKTEQY